MTALGSDVAAFRRQLEEPSAAQSEVLAQTLAKNTDCEIGRRCGFASIRTMDEFRRALPIVRYADVAPTIDRIVHGGEQGLLTTEPVRRFFLTSGSTAKSKFIPVTASLIQAKARAFSAYWSSVFEGHPNVPRERIVTNFSDTGHAVRTPGGLMCSSESAYWASVTRASALGREPLVPACVSQTGDSEARYYAIARMLVEADVAGIMTLNPSTTLLLFEKIVQHAAALADDVERGTLRDDLGIDARVHALVASRCSPNPKRAAQIRALASAGQLWAHRLWPQLELGICWRSPMLRRYLDLLAPHLGAAVQRDFITMASEGVMAIPLADDAPGRVDGGPVGGGPIAVASHVFEFIPLADAEQAQPQTVLPEDLEVGGRYVVVMTNGAGLYRYNIGDVVEVTGHVGRTPCLQFLHRVGSTCSLTGEKLTEVQVTAAVVEAAESLASSLAAFTVAPAPDGFPRYVALMEFKDVMPSAATLGGLPQRLDEALEQHNVEYGAKRSSQRLGAPEVWLVGPGGYERYRRQRLAGGTSDSQFKPVHLTRDANFSEQFEIMERFSAS